MTERTPTVSYPLREQRRRANRLAFLESARGLFSARGFSETTMEEIADQAELHVQTLYRHFPTKHALFTAIQIEVFRNALTSRTVDTLAFWRDYVEKAATGVIGHGDSAQFQLYVRDPKLTASRAEVRVESTELLAQGIREDFDFAGEHMPILVANMLWGGNADAVRRWSETGGNNLVDLATAMADEVNAIAFDRLGLVKRV